MGLLDFFSSSPGSQSAIGGLLGLSPDTQNRITGLLGRLEGLQSPDNPMRRAREDQQRQSIVQQQMLHAQEDRDFQRSQRQRLLQQQQREDRISDLAGHYYTPPRPESQGMDRPSLNEAQQGGYDLSGYINAVKGIDPIRGMQLEASLRKQEAPIKLGAGDVLLDPTTHRPLASNPKADDLPTAVREYQYAQQQGYQGSFDQWDQVRRRAGASNVSVNTGQKGFDNTLKLRGDFRSEPIYKAQQEMQSAYSQITQALGKGSPIGDTAAATKIMKLLDPGSVVRESELGMAMAASGLMDRVENYASNVINGTKLTPQQRKDFKALADALYSESVKQYNSKRGEYQGIAERNGLETADVLGPEPSMPQVTDTDALVEKYRSRKPGGGR